MGKDVSIDMEQRLIQYFGVGVSVGLRNVHFYLIGLKQI